jgi:hypothetical protein
MSHEEFDTEPVRGLPESPPEDERILWQGAPAWRPLAWRAFGVRLVVLYFAAMAAWRAADMWAGGAAAGEIAAGVLSLLAMGAAAVGVLALMAFVTARNTVYTITTRRVAMRIGVALTVTLNLPFRWIGTAALRTNRDGSGTIALALLGEDRLAYLMLWPHARPWKMARAQPALREIPNAGAVAELLARALREAQAEPGAEVAPPAGAPARGRPEARPEPGLVPAE